MEMVRIFGLPAALLVLAFVANRLSKLTRVPDVIVLLLIGITIGPILHWVHSQTFEGAIHVLGMLALILILFEGGLELRLRQALRYFPAGLLLVLLSFGLSMGLVALIGRALLHLAWNDCLLMGAALGCTSGAIVIPALQQMVVAEPVKITLTIEAALGEVIAVLIVGSMLNMVPNHPLLTGMAADFSQNIVLAVVLGVTVGAMWSRLWPLVAGLPYSNILNLGVVLGVFAIARYAGGSGLLGVLIFGITLANMPRTPHTTRQGARMVAFHAELSFLVRSFFFVMLGIVAEFVSREYIVPILGILAALVLARFLAVQLSRWAVRDVEGQADSVTVLDAATRSSHGGVSAGNRRCSRRRLCILAGNGLHRRAGDEPVHRVGCGQVGTGRGICTTTTNEASSDGTVTGPGVRRVSAASFSTN